MSILPRWTSAISISLQRSMQQALLLTWQTGAIHNAAVGRAIPDTVLAAQVGTACAIEQLRGAALIQNQSITGEEQ